MYEFIRLQYVMGKITADQVMAFVPKYITAEQAAEIIGVAGGYTEIVSNMNIYEGDNR